MENDNVAFEPQPERSQNAYAPPPKVPVKNVVIKYAIISCLLTIISSLTFNLSGITKPGASMGENMIPMVVNLGIFIYVVSSACREYRDKENGGYIKLGTCIQIGVFISLINGLIAGIFSAIYMHYIDPAMMQDMMNAQLSAMESKGMSDEEIEQAMKFAGIATNPFFLVVITVFMSAIFGLIGSLLIGLVVRKEM